MTEPVGRPQVIIKPTCACFLIAVIQVCGFVYPVYAAENPPTASKQGLSGVLNQNLATAMEEKQEFERYVQKQLQALEGKVQTLREKSTDFHELTKSQLNEKLETLKEKKVDLLSKVEKLRNSSEHTWQDIRANILKTLKDLNQSLPQPSTSE
ncbi:MAG: hypothetical protein NPIRA05_15570 [Nitrospirales bacterium]|nr:MAG: hypothetical protein NPIRA05_15570 [Nitrospirales bacterium]